MNEPRIQIRFCIFADVVGFNSIEDKELPDFVDQFLASATALFEDTESQLTPPCYRNTWGDALFLVFETAQAAGNAALALRKMMQTENIKLGSQTAPLQLRIGIHCGPVLDVYDPITKRPTLLGSNVNQAARIEPVTEEGQIYVSQDFAALSAFEGTSGFKCIPQGLADLPKKSGRIRVYRIVETNNSQPPTR